ncbi:phosphoribosylglycinamide formyltransferase [Arenibacter sp. GZD96]|uniref:phosphoribosylglycinamide formyltransferase n=1 Tax=Aurantibrevibacter litoralis TaxID=3106030 RepID=UPI002AFE5A8E|nr:phosphoribosylglycinamide formyltransferase [Arenibacter sp. GZD-96]MEA1785662.1 phosphoribosylglycinamide formyltransferase [Arenibacter sp. GZD-96]
MKHIVLFASGSGSNVENISNYFSKNKEVVIDCVFTNNREALVLDRCNRLKISSLCFNRTSFYESDCILSVVKTFNPDVIVLAGFLWKIPEHIIRAFPKKIVNIHPALLPKYGGKGMYGMHVHQAVKDNQENETGITVHYVNENYDEGAIIGQVTTQIDLNDSAMQIAEKVHQLEYVHYPKFIENVLYGNV